MVLCLILFAFLFGYIIGVIFGKIGRREYEASQLLTKYDTVHKENRND